ncbi:hypothetical protein Q7P36_003018 [Cladosporium allicinum]
MRLAVTFCLTLATGLVESRPSTLPADVSELNVKQRIDNVVGARGLGDVLHNALNKHSSDSDVTSTSASDASTTTASSPVSAASSTTSSASFTQTSSPPSSSSTASTPSSSSSANSPSSSHLSLGSLLGGGLKNQGSEDAKAETYGNDKITTYHSLGTSGDRVGFSWVPVASSE